MAHPFEGIERKIAGMGEGMIPDTMSFFDDLPEQLFIAFYLVSDAKKAGGSYVTYSGIVKR